MHTSPVWWFENEWKTFDWLSIWRLPATSEWPRHQDHADQKAVRTLTTLHASDGDYQHTADHVTSLTIVIITFNHRTRSGRWWMTIVIQWKLFRWNETVCLNDSYVKIWAICHEFQNLIKRNRYIHAYLIMVSLTVGFNEHLLPFSECATNITNAQSFCAFCSCW